METPTPVDLNKLKSILGNAKKVMAVTEQKFPTKKTSGESRMNENVGYSHPSTPMYDENDEREPEYPTYINQPQREMVNENRDIYQPMNYDEQAVLNSKLPPAIKEAMLKNPIPKLSGPPSKFSLDDLSDLVEKPKPKQNFKSPSVPLRESSNDYIPSGTINITVDLLNEMIDKRVNEILAKMFTKTISEQAIKKTISTLITEGKISTKKK
jgi:hypothetical protein